MKHTFCSKLPHSYRLLVIQNFKKIAEEKFKLLMNLLMRSRIFLFFFFFTQSSLEAENAARRFIFKEEMKFSILKFDEKLSVILENKIDLKTKLIKKIHKLSENKNFPPTLYNSKNYETTRLY